MFFMVAILPSKSPLKQFSIFAHFFFDILSFFFEWRPSTRPIRHSQLQLFIIFLFVYALRGNHAQLGTQRPKRTLTFLLFFDFFFFSFLIFLNGALPPVQFAIPNSNFLLFFLFVCALR